MIRPSSWQFRVQVANSSLVLVGILLLISCGRAASVQTAANHPDHGQVATPAIGAITSVRRDDDPIARAPRVAAARMRLAAARGSAIAAGVLPDPMLDVQHMRMPRDPEYGDGWMIEVGQTLPRWGERDGMRGMAAAEVAMAEADLAMARGETLARLSMYHAQARAAQAKASAYRENAQRAENLAELIAKSAAATGGARLAEVLTLRSRSAALEISAREAQFAMTDARGRGRALLGLPASADLPDPGLPATERIDRARNPRLRLAEAVRAQAQAQLSIAASRSRPEVSLRAGWQREGSEAMDEYRVGLRVALPINPSSWRGPEQAAWRRRDAADLDAVGAGVDADEVLARVGRAREQAVRARTVAGETKQRLGLELENIASAAATGEQGSTAMIFERLDMLADTEVMAVMAEAEAAMAAAELWMLMPTPDAVVKPMKLLQTTDRP